MVSKAIARPKPPNRKKAARPLGVHPTRRVGPSYLALIHRHALRPIRSDGELDSAIAVLDELLKREPLDQDEQDYLESLSHAIERYEKDAYPMPAVSGAGMLRHLIDAREVSLSEVATKTGLALSTLSAILNGKRNLNLNHLRALSRYFGVEASVFLN